MPVEPVVLLACGNTLRGDDGVAWNIGLAIEEIPLLAAVKVTFTQQLLPEHAELLKDKESVLFLDCSAVSEPGTVSTIALNPAPSLPRILTHHLDPASLLRLTQDLYGKAPPVAYAITVGGASFALGEQLSSKVEAAIPVAIDAVTRVLLETQQNAQQRRTTAFLDR
jgi:hydrogenase maturation protease